MSDGAEYADQPAERAMQASWVFDSSLCATVVEAAAPILESCRCVACRGLRFAGTTDAPPEKPRAIARTMTITA